MNYSPQPCGWCRVCVVKSVLCTATASGAGKSSSRASQMSPTTMADEKLGFEACVAALGTSTVSLNLAECYCGLIHDNDRKSQIENIWKCQCSELILLRPGILHLV